MPMIFEALRDTYLVVTAGSAFLENLIETNFIGTKVEAEFSSFLQHLVLAGLSCKFVHSFQFQRGYWDG
jgi:hypothetical protein